jgi:dTDP-4-dehydrorhamnose reductase
LSKKILITGGTGMLGKSLKKKFTNQYSLEGSKHFDLTKKDSLIHISELPDFDLIIHTAAITDLKENEIYPEAAYQLHAGIIPYLQKKCKKLIYISAQGRNHKGVYYKTKFEGEKLTLKRENDLVIRTNIIGNGGLREWALRELKNNNKIRGFTNVYFNPVHVDQLSEFIAKNINLKGVVNFCSTEKISKYQFLRKLSSIYNFSDKNVLPVKFKKSRDLTVKENPNIKTYKVDLRIL